MFVTPKRRFALFGKNRRDRAILARDELVSIDERAA
jgi:hypothetical protein